MDIGDCANVHDLALRADYEAASKEREYGYELDVSRPNANCALRPHVSIY